MKNDINIEKTQRLYYDDSELYEFCATVINSEFRDDGKYETILDKTAFFPEGGGQYGDTGKIDGHIVYDTVERDGYIIHITDFEFEKGSTVNCIIDKSKRFSKMQNHSGEHIVSGLIKKHYDLDNVGFHLGHNDVTIDFDGKLSREQLDYIERMSNDVVYSNIPIIAEFSSADELKKLNYRSKINLDENVRIVKIGEVDICACCAPHVKFTGEIGIIKLLDFASYKGGTRIHMLCGRDAVDDYRKKYAAIYKISSMLSVKQSEAAEKFCEYMDENIKLKAEYKASQKEILKYKAACLTQDENKNLIVFDRISSSLLNDYSKILVGHCENIAAVFSGDDGSGYNFVITTSSSDINLKTISDLLAKNLNAKCGGSKSLVQGFVNSEKNDIIKFLAQNLH